MLRGFLSLATGAPAQTWPHTHPHSAPSARPPSWSRRCRGPHRSHWSPGVGVSEEDGVTKLGPQNPQLSAAAWSPRACFWLGKEEHAPGRLCAQGQVRSPPVPWESGGTRRAPARTASPMLRRSRWGPPSPLPLTTDAASSKPSAPQLMTRARTPSRQTLGAEKGRQHPQTRAREGQAPGCVWGFPPTGSVAPPGADPVPDPLTGEGGELTQGAGWGWPSLTPPGCPWSCG